MVVGDEGIELEFFVVDEPPSRSREDVAALVNSASEIAWPLGPPDVIDETEVIDGEAAESDEALEWRKEVASIIAESAKNVIWPLGAPASRRPESVQRRPSVGSVERRVLGGRLLLHDQRHLASGKVPINVSRREYLAMAELITRLAAYAKEHACTWSVRLAGDEIGEINPGGPDDGVARGLMREWERSLLEREHGEKSS